MIPYGKQIISQNDIEEVVEVLKSDFLTQGPQVELFENKIKSSCNVKFASAVSSATAALHISCIALGIKKGDFGWTSPNSFVASANCLRLCDAEVDFVDIDPETWNVSIKALKEKIFKAKKNNILPKVFIPVHFAGASCEMEEIYYICNENKIKVIEDASHAIGGFYKNYPVGSSKFSDISVFSFHPVKIITSAEGGMVLTNDDEINEKVKLLRTHGVTRKIDLLKKRNPEPWYYEQKTLGLNYRMNDLQAALGKSQIDSLCDFVRVRENLAKKYIENLTGLHLQLPKINKDIKSSWHLFVVRIKDYETKITKRELFETLRSKKIGVNVHYIPIYLHPYYQKLNFKKNYCIEAEKYYKEAITLPLHPSLSSNEQDYIIDTLREHVV